MQNNLQRFAGRHRRKRVSMMNNNRNRTVLPGVTQKRTWSGQLGMLTLTGIFTALIIIFTAFIGHIPYGVNGGYVHFGDAVIYLAAAVLPRPYAMLAAAVGGGMSDLMTAPQWMIATILIKPLLVIPFSNRSERIVSRGNILATVAAFLISSLGYYIAGLVIFGNAGGFLLALPGDLLQSGGSAAAFIAIGRALDGYGIRKRIK